MDGRESGSRTNGSQWYDFVYVSENENFDEATATYIGGFPNVKALNTGDYYIQKQTLDVPITAQGKYFVFVVTDVFNRIEETVTEDNYTAAYPLCKSILPKTDITLNLAEAGVTEISPMEMMNPMPTDCEAPEIWLNRTTFDCATIGLNQLVLYAKNQVGIIDSVTVSLRVTDDSVVCNGCQAVDLLMETPMLKSGVYIAGNNIRTTGAINKDSTVILRAGQSIQLLPGFHAQAEANFWAQILDCSVALEAQAKVTDTRSTTFLKQVEKITAITLKAAPNPFQESTNIQFDLPAAAVVNLAVYDVNGQVVKSLIREEFYELGPHQLVFENENYAPTIYFLVLKTENEQVVQKLMLIR